MSEEEHEHQTEVFYVDIAVRLIETEVLKNNTPKLALVLIEALEMCLPDEEDSESVIEFKEQMLASVIHLLLYHEAAYLPTEEEIDGETKKFADWLKDAAAEITPTTPTEEEN